jgi:hypothetical protein
MARNNVIGKEKQTSGRSPPSIIHVKFPKT